VDNIRIAFHSYICHNIAGGIVVNKIELEQLYKAGSTLRLQIIQCEDMEIDARMKIAKLNKEIRDVEKSIYGIDEKKKHAQKAILELFK